MAKMNKRIAKATTEQLQEALQTFLDYPKDCTADSHEREDTVEVCTCIAKKMALAINARPSLFGADDDEYDDDGELLGTYNKKGEFILVEHGAWSKE